MQSGSNEDPVRVSAAGKRQRQASNKGLLGAVVGVLAPGQIAEPGCGSMTALSRFGEVGKERRRPLLQPVTVEAKTALAPADGDVAGDQRVR